MTNLNDVLLAMSNIPVDDPIAEIWGRGLQGGGYAVIEYTGALPITINANGQPLIDYRIYGNTEQTGTPTPENPIMPIGCGESTENLLAANNTSVTVSTVTVSNDNGKITVIGRASYEITSTNLVWKNAFTFRLKAGSYYFAGRASGGISSYLRNANDDTRISVPNESFVLSNDTDVYLGFWLYNNGNVTFNIMLNLGSTPLPYEPYGYKLPILSNSNVVDIYLGEAETTRRIKKVTLTGNETFYRDYERNDSWRFYSLPIVQGAGNVGICSHFEYIGTTRVNQSDSIGYSLFSASQFGCRFPKSIANTVNEFKTWLAQQYTAGTPVTVWYVLAEPETGIVNEPLMKIGDYADTVNMEQAGVSIPTNKDTTIIDYDGALKPSQMYIKYLGVKK